jgi:hypothetical protein
MEPARGERSRRGQSDGMHPQQRVDEAEMKLDQQAWGGRRGGRKGKADAGAMMDWG